MEPLRVHCGITLHGAVSIRQGGPRRNVWGIGEGGKGTEPEEVDSRSACVEVLLEHEDAVLEAAAQVLRGGELGAERAVGHGEQGAHLVGRHTPPTTPHLIYNNNKNNN